MNAALLEYKDTHENDLVEQNKKEKAAGSSAYRTLHIFEDGHQFDLDGIKVLVITKFMDYNLFKKKVMEKLKLSRIVRVAIVPEKGEEIDIKEDLTLLKDQDVVRIVGESYIQRMRELEEYEKEGKRIAEERRLDLKKRVARHKALKLGLPDPFAPRKDDEDIYDYDSDGPAIAEFKGINVPITFKPGPGNKLNAVVVGELLDIKYRLRAHSLILITQNISS
jgi:hypothetical protein